MREAGKVYDLIVLNDRNVFSLENDTIRISGLIWDASERLAKDLECAGFDACGRTKREEARSGFSVYMPDYIINFEKSEGEEIKEVGRVVEDGRVFIYDCPPELENLLDGIVSGIE